MPPGTLYVVATPLGHLGDLSPRGAETLKTVHTVAAEDTRRTRQLLSAIDAHPKLVSYHANSDPKRARKLIEMMLEGIDIGLVTDAGTPAISDPGVELVRAAREAGIRVIPIPGPSAVATALSASGLVGDRYLFLGFLPRKGTERRRLLERAAGEAWSVVFFEAPTRLVSLLEDLSTVAGTDRVAVVARELTKVHEEVRSDTLEALGAYYEKVPPRGEITVILSGRAIEENAPAVDPAEIAATIRARLAAGDSRKDVVRMVSERFGLARNDAYQLVMDAT